MTREAEVAVRRELARLSRRWVPVGVVLLLASHEREHNGVCLYVPRRPARRQTGRWTRRTRAREYGRCTQPGALYGACS